MNINAKLILGGMSVLIIGGLSFYGEQNKDRDDSGILSADFITSHVSKYTGPVSAPLQSCIKYLNHHDLYFVHHKMTIPQ